MNSPNPDPPRERFVLNSTRRMWHFTDPTTPYYTLCGRSSSPMYSGAPERTCSQCSAAYAREINEGDRDD